MAEVYYYPKIEEVIKKILKLSQPAVIAVAGGSGSGKGFVTKKLIEKINEINGKETSSLLKMDNYFKDKKDPTLPRDEEGRKVYDVPGSYHIKEYFFHLEKLTQGQDILMPIYEKKTNSRLRYTELIESAPFIFFEGLFSFYFYSIIMEKYNLLKVYVDTNEDVRFKGRLKRDMNELGETREFIENMWKFRVLPNHKKFVEPQREIADIIIVNNYEV